MQLNVWNDLAKAKRRWSWTEKKQRNREDEIIQWSSYLDELVAWAAQASLEFSTEISHAARWLKEIIRAAFVNHPMFEPHGIFL